VAVKSVKTVAFDVFGMSRRTVNYVTKDLTLEVKAKDITRLDRNTPDRTGSSLPNFTLIGATCSPCGAKNRKFDPE